MIHAHQFTNGTRCRGTLRPYVVRRHLISGWVRCTACGLVGIPIPLPKTRSRPGESLSVSARAASVLSCDPTTEHTGE